MLSLPPPDKGSPPITAPPPDPLCMDRTFSLPLITSSPPHQPQASTEGWLAKGRANGYKTLRDYSHTKRIH